MSQQDKKTLIQQTGKDVKIFDIPGTSQYVVSVMTTDYCFTEVEDARKFAIQAASQFHNFENMKKTFPIPAVKY